MRAVQVSQGASASGIPVFTPNTAPSLKEAARETNT